MATSRTARKQERIGAMIIGRVTRTLAVWSALVPLTAQTWNTPAAADLARSGVAQRQESQADSALRSWRTRAHGFVFFLAQIGSGLAGPPRLVKADELDVEVY